MENDNRSQQSIFTPQSQPPLPNATAILVLGILSLVLCFCYGIFGLACGIIAIVMAKKDMALYNASPGFYSTSSFNNVKAGRICAIIGVCLSAAYIIAIVVYLVIFGAAILSHPWTWQNGSY